MASQNEQTATKVRRAYDFSLLFAVIFITIFGIVMIYSASISDLNSTSNMTSQLKNASGALVIALVLSKLDYHWYRKLANLGYVVAVSLMVYVNIWGNEINGKRRWINIGGQSLQPSEIVKIVLIVVLANYIVRVGSGINKKKQVFQYFCLVSIPASMVLINNLSTGIIIFGIALTMLFVVTRDKWWYIFLGLLGVVGYFFAVPIAYFLEEIGLLQAYQLERIYVWADPAKYSLEGGYQVLQGLYAIGSGGWMGKGLGESLQKRGFIPEAHNDMIFSIICEELGLFGAVSIILIFLFIIYRIAFIALNAPDLFGSLISIGVMAQIAIQVFLNIAVVTNTIPNTGVTLPFISYGGTAILVLIVEIGMVLSV